MKDLFVGKTFSEELEFWDYLQNLKQDHFNCADGYYCAHAHGLSKNFEVYRLDHYATYEIYNQASYTVPFSPTRFVLGVRDKSLFEIFFTSHTVTGMLEKKMDFWQQTHFRDLFEDDSFMPQKITKVEMEESCKELVELLIIKSKKID